MKWFITLILLSVSFASFGQKLKKRTETNGNITATYTVLEEDKKIKHGTFELRYRETLLQRGTYKNGERSGAWQFYNFQQELVHRYNYDTKQLVQYKEDSKNELMENIEIIDEGVKASTPDSKPILIGGAIRMYHGLNRSLDYPLQARRNGTEGTVLSEVTITQDGRIVNERIISDIGSGCGEEVLRILKLIPDDWIPAYVDGEPVAVKIQIKTEFKLR